MNIISRIVVSILKFAAVVSSNEKYRSQVLTHPTELGQSEGKKKGEVKLSIFHDAKAW